MSTVALDRDRLAKLLGMLGSAHDGEIVAAARQAERLRVDAGLSWTEVLVPRLPPPSHGQNVRTVSDAIRFVLQRADMLTDWEREFAQSVARLQSPLTPKQQAVLQRLVEKAQRAGASAA